MHDILLGKNKVYNNKQIHNLKHFNPRVKSLTGKGSDRNLLLNQTVRVMERSVSFYQTYVIYTDALTAV